MLSCVQLFMTPLTAAHRVPLSKGFSRQGYWSGLPSPPPGDLPDPGTEPESPANPYLLHCRQILYCLSHQGSPTWPLPTPDFYVPEATQWVAELKPRLPDSNARECQGPSPNNGPRVVCYLIHNLPPEEPLQQPLHGLGIPAQLHPAEMLLDQQVRALETGLSDRSHQKAVLMKVVAFRRSIS